MTIFVTFVMGVKEAYFFNSPTHWAWHNLPPDVEALFVKQPPIKDVIEFALGDHGTYFISYRDHDGQVLCRHYNLPNPLTEYLYHSHPHVIRDLATLSITLGPYESYYAHDKTSASWANLPPALEKAVEKRLITQDAWKTLWKEDGAEAPSFVSLGADGSYFMRTVKGGGSWDLKHKSDGMIGTNKFLEESKDFSGVAGVYLFPFNNDSYILLLTSGKAFSNLPEHTWPDYNKMAPALPALVQTMSPIPCMPQIRQQAPPQPQPQIQPQMQMQPQRPAPPGCCPPPGWNPPRNPYGIPLPQINGHNHFPPPYTSSPTMINSHTSGPNSRFPSSNNYSSTGYSSSNNYSSTDYSSSNSGGFSSSGGGTTSGFS